MPTSTPTATPLPTVPGVDAPIWFQGDWWVFDESLYITGPTIGEDGFFDIQTTATYYNLGSHPLPIAENVPDVDVYDLQINGTFDLLGRTYIDFDIDKLAVDLRVRDGDYRGSWLLTTDQLSTVHRSRNMYGILEIDMGAGWGEVGYIYFNEYEDYQPPIRDYNFTLRVGDRWRDHSTVHTYGDMNIQFMIGYETFDSEFELDLNIACLYRTEVNGFESHYIFEDARDGNTTLHYYYAPDAKWFARMIQREVGFGDDTLDEGRMELIELYLITATPTATPSGAPTYTPSNTSTATPTTTMTPTPTWTATDTSTPTIPSSPTPTGTPTAMPTNTYTATFTPTIIATITPSSTATATPTATAGLRPMILACGYMYTSITEADGGLLAVYVLTDDPNPAQVTSVEIYYTGIGTGAYLPAIPEYEGVFGLVDIPVGAGIEAKRYLFEFKATNELGLQSLLAPYLQCLD